MYERLITWFGFRLAQCQLNGRYQPQEILSEAVLRLELARERGINVYNEEAWLRTAGFLYILEIRRRESRFTTTNADVDRLFQSSHISTYQSVGVEHLEAEETNELLNQAIQELPPEARELVVMRFYENMSWEAIARFYAARGKIISVATLRQRGSRAIKSLRQIYIKRMQ